MRRITFFKTMLLAIVMMLVSGNVWGQTNNYFGTSGTMSDNVWSTNPAGPYTSALFTTGGPILYFNNSGSVTFTSVASALGFNFGASMTWTAGGTIGAAGINLPINVSIGISQNIGSQGFSTSTTAAITKNGLGELVMSGISTNLKGGFTLNAGTLVASGVNALGNGALTINGGTISGTATKTFEGKLTEITIAGDFTLGATTGLSASAANLTFDAPTSLTGTTRTITLGGTGTYTLNGVISGVGSSLVLNETALGTLVFGGTSTYDGSTTINGGTLKLNATGGALKSGNEVIIGGGLLEITQSQTIGNLTMTSGTLKVNSGQILTITGTYNVSGGTINNLGTIVLQGNALQTFPGSAATINNGTEGLMTALTVNNSVGVLIDNSFTVNTVTIKPGSKLTLNIGKTLTVTNFTNNSDATGTGTLLDNGTLIVSGTTNVQQFLNGHTGTSTRANWYLSSPVSAATCSVFDVATLTNKLTYYNETVPGYAAQITNNATALTPGVGYVTYIGGGDATYTFTGGSLNNGDITLTPTRTGTAEGKRGFNLVGNPYPSYLDWNSVEKTNVRSTIWYRTLLSGSSTGVMTFDTFDGTTGTANGQNGAVSRYIPPMQAFWVRVDADPVLPDTQSTGSLVFKNTARSHQDQSLVTNRLRAPKIDESQILRLKVSNGINSDAAIVVTDPNAMDVFDNYDSQKMTNANVNVPEIFTLAGSEELVINHMNSLGENKEMTLGFRPGKTSDFTIEATEVSNFSNDMKVMLLDKLTGVEQELAVGSPYSFTSDATATNDRFSILFKTSSIATGLNNATNNQNVLVYRNLNNHIAVICNQGIDDLSSVSIYNAVGQKLSNQKLAKTSTEINGAFTAGVYLVTVHNGGQTVTKKVIIK